MKLLRGPLFEGSSISSVIPQRYFQQCYASQEPPGYTE